MNLFSIPEVIFVSPHEHGVNASSTESHPFGLTAAKWVGFSINVPNGITAGTFKFYYTGGASDAGTWNTDATADVDITGAGDRNHASPILQVNMAGVGKIVASGITGSPVTAGARLEVRLHLSTDD